MARQRLLVTTPRRPREQDGERSTSSAKRARTEEFAPGSVVRMSMKNFMTYSSATIEFGPRLNLFLGPNGTGKSSFVCALCLGLAGSTKVLGRADDLADYVRRGETEGWVEIVLATSIPGKYTTISRHMHSKDNSSEWKLDGRIAKMADIKALAKEYNIQVDNLCTFLPQDKVSFFARLNPRELLLETEKAIGESSLYDLHAQLVLQRRELNTLENQARSLQIKLEALQRENEANERDCRRFETRQKLLDQASEFAARIAWLTFLKKQSEYLTVKKDFEDARKKEKDKELALHKKQAPLADKRAEMEEMQQEVQRSRKRMVAEDTQLNNLLTKDREDLKRDVEKKRAELEKLEAAAERRNKNIAKYKQEMEDLQAALADLPSSQEARVDTSQEQAALKDKLAQLHTEITQLTHSDEDATRNYLEKKDDAQRLLGELTELDNVKAQKMHKLERPFAGITAFSAWVERAQMEGRFRGRVYGPLLLEVSVPDPQHAAFLEQACRFDLWARFVTEFPEDQDLLYSAAANATTNYRGQSFKPIVSCYSGNPNVPINHPHGDASQFTERYGVTHTLDEVFEAPPVVKHVFNDEANLCISYVGTERTNAEVFLNEQSQVRKLSVPEGSYHVTVSQYNRSQRSTSYSATRERRFLGDSGPEGAGERERINLELESVTQAMACLEGELKALKAEKSAKAAEKQAVDMELRALIEQGRKLADRRRNIETQLTVKRNMLRNEEGKPDPLRGAPKLQADLAALHAKTKKLVLGLPARIAAFWSMHQEHFLKELRAKELTLQIEEAGKLGKSQERELAVAKEETKRRKAIAEAFIDKLRELKDKAVEMTDNVDLTAPEASETRWAEVFAGMPDDLEQLSRERDKRMEEAEGIVCANMQVMDEYKRRQVDIHRVEKELAEENNRFAVAQALLQDKRNEWEPQLRRIVSIVNTNFTANMADMGCAGCVELDAPSDDFANWALLLKVKYRDSEELQQLTSSRQSGGERSVATILYLIALQGVTTCPFRVVDEINQGMDAINERKVFHQLAQQACREGTPQCFLLTPKLLPDLPFSADVKVLQIMNGELIKEAAASWSLAKVCGDRSMVHNTAVNATGAAC